MKYIVATVGYQHLAIPVESGAQAAAVAAAFSEAVLVTTKGYGAEERFIASEGGEPVQLRFVQADKVLVGNEIESLRVLLKEAQASASQYQKWWSDANTKLKAQTPAPVPAPADDEIPL